MLISTKTFADLLTMTVRKGRMKKRGGFQVELTARKGRMKKGEDNERGGVPS